MKIFDNSVSVFEKALDMTAKRNELISSNLANRDTPGYKAQDVSFEKQLQEAYSKPQMPALKVTDPRHFHGIKVDSIGDVKGEVFQTFNPEPKLDGNTVDLDQEMSKMAANQLMYQADIRMINYKLRSLRNAIEEGGR